MTSFLCWLAVCASISRSSAKPIGSEQRSLPLSDTGCRPEQMDYG